SVARANLLAPVPSSPYSAPERSSEPLHTRLANIHDAAQRLRDGGVVAFPTETVYGLGADAMSHRAVDRVFTLKGRPSTNPLIVHACDEAMARTIVREWPEHAAALARAFWPGPLTIVLPKAPGVPLNVTAAGPNVAVRCPDHPVAIALIEALERPIVGPSANLSGRVSPTAAAHVRESFSPEDVLVLDGGPCRAGIESTVVSLAEGTPRILRQGVVTPEMIAGVIGVRPLVALHAADVTGPAAPMASPGMLRSHYAPAAKAVLFNPTRWPAVLNGAAVVVVVTHDRTRAAPPPPPPHRVVLLPDDATGYAARLYAALREADSMKPGLIAIERPEGVGGVWDALRDRLERATAE
ncbi:MAG: L-threonylcarbamoyladenylate synthase, partial [Phycisphaerales bacterium]